MNNQAPDGATHYSVVQSTKYYLKDLCENEKTATVYSNVNKNWAGRYSYELANRIDTDASSGCGVEINKLNTHKPVGASEDQSEPCGAGISITALVMHDLIERTEKGIETYGQALRASNGRSALLDAYQEALDLAMYLRQAIEEQG